MYEPAHFLSGGAGKGRFAAALAIIPHSSFTISFLLAVEWGRGDLVQRRISEGMPAQQLASLGHALAASFAIEAQYGKCDPAAPRPDC